jgi:hypothetical protein
VRITGSCRKYIVFVADREGAFAYLGEQPPQPGETITLIEPGPLDVRVVEIRKVGGVETSVAEPLERAGHLRLV